MTPLKVGTIGYGGAYNMGRQHLQELVSHPGFVAEAVCDIDPTRVAEATKDFPGIQTFTDVGEMLAQSEVELLVIILPHNLHASVSLQCLEAGRHVVVEKPFTITVEEADTLIAAAEKAGKVVSTYHNRHWDSVARTLVANVGRIGRPYRWDSVFGHYGRPRADWWRADKAISGGIIYDWGAHFCEWMLQVMPGAMTEVSGFAVDGIWPVSNEDELTTSIRFADGAWATHTTTDLALPQKPQIHLQGTEGAIYGHMNGLTLAKAGDDGRVQTEQLEMLEATNSEYYRNLHDHLHHGEELVITPEYARRVIQCLDLATKSAEQGKTLPAAYA